MSQEPQAVIALRRPNNLMLGGKRDLLVSIDGHRAGLLKPGQIAEFPVSAGEHFVVVSIDLARTRPLRVTASPGTRTELIVGAPPRFRQTLFLKVILPLVLVLCATEAISALVRGTGATLGWTIMIMAGYAAATHWFIKDYWALYALTPAEAPAVVAGSNSS